jgi:hypothetical protein
MPKEAAMVIRRVGVGSLAKMTAVVYAAIGLLVGAFFAAFAAIGAGMGAASGEETGALAALFGVGAVVLMPIVYGVMGLVGGAITALVYNAAAGVVGGVVLETEAVGQP